MLLRWKSAFSTKKKNVSVKLDIYLIYPLNLQLMTVSLPRRQADQGIQQMKDGTEKDMLKGIVRNRIRIGI